METMTMAGATESDKAPKLEPKLTMAKASEVVGPKVEALISEALAGFELDPADKKSHKRLARAFLIGVLKGFDGKGELNSYRLQRQVVYAFNSVYGDSPKAKASDDSGEAEVFEIEGGQE